MRSADVFYKAMLARDYRFDGKFFVGVKTTGIYCRPICPAKPKRENVQFFPSALSAERAGFRPCLRCRPEAAPASPAWIGKSAVVQRALREIGQHGHIPSDGEEFASRFGVTSRHLRRLFLNELGRTPKQISDGNRLNFARGLVVETALPLTVIAMTSGFSSLRRFNDAFKKRFHRAPSALRRKAEAAPGLRLSLSLRPPYDFTTILDYYRRHRIVGVEEVGEDFYQRVFRLQGKAGVLRITAQLDSAKLCVEVTGADASVLFALTQRVRRMFDLDSDPLLVANAFAGHRQLGKLWTRDPGLRLPCSWDIYEGVITTILGQLVSQAQAGRLVAQLVQAYGEKVRLPGSEREFTLFPAPEVLALADLNEVKTTQARKESIREFSRAVAQGDFSLSVHQDPKEFRRRLLTIKGIGPWSVEYMALRALGDTDAFPAADLVLKRALQTRGGVDLESVRPWRAYAALYLWKEQAQLSKGVTK
ncbi:MAG: DNA-3-methyladenine glycosylase 2 family protein [Bdellovibrionales bacterium]|nr:DNA-3-methyladenine glycosylase 2 family protein [Bdellovibrionales bacterium]